MKESSIGPPTKYLWGKLREGELENGQKYLAFGPKEYAEAAAQNVVDYLKKREKSLISKA